MIEEGEEPLQHMRMNLRNVNCYKDILDPIRYVSKRLRQMEHIIKALDEGLSYNKEEDKEI